MKVKVIKIISFLLIFFILLYFINNILKLKSGDGYYQTSIFYRQRNNSIDVLFLGSSHSFVNIYSYYLYDLYGMASYNLGGGGQPIWNTYYFFNEALKTQKPKLVVLEILEIIFNKDYSFDARIIKNTYGLKFSKDKIESIIISSPKSRWNYFLNPLLQYHNRYSILTDDDFLKYKGQKIKYKYSKGENVTYGTRVNNIPIINDTTNTKKLYWKSEKYYRMIIELAKEKNIPIILIKSPHNIYDYEYKEFRINKAIIQELYNMIEEIANEYNVPYINYNYDYNKYGVDFTNDFSDLWGHLNYKGARNFTKHIGQYIKSNYDLPDRRGDPKYYSWEINSKYNNKAIYNFELKQFTNFNEYIEKVKSADDYVIGITMLGNYKKDDDIVKSVASNFNINDIYLKNASYVLDNNKLIFSSSGSNQYLFHDEIGSYTDLVLDSGQKLSINRKNYIKTKNGINMVIYDKFTEEIVDNIYLEYKGNSINPTIKR